MSVSSIGTFLSAMKKSEAKSQRKEQLASLVSQLVSADAATFKAKKPELDRLVSEVRADEVDSRAIERRANEERAKRSAPRFNGSRVFLHTMWVGDLKGGVDRALAALEAQLDDAGDAAQAFELLRQRNQLKAIARSLSPLQ